jgi:uncharacterized protein (DUF1697 family)
MPRYVAFLRGVSPMNARMAKVRQAFERAGFTNAKTVLASGNVAFDARASSESALARKAQAAMAKHLGRSFYTIVRSTKRLRALIEADPFARVRLPAKGKRVVTFLGKRRRPKLSLPIEVEGARILAVKGGEAFTIYVPQPRRPVFMTLIEKTFGREVTTRTWETVRKCAAA